MNTGTRQGKSTRSLTVSGTTRGTYVLETELGLAEPLDRIFPFFADAGNLERITPPWLRFRIVTEQPIEMSEGTTIDYDLRIRGVPLRWRSEIAVWDPPHRFVDRQIRGPYRLWVHDHRFAQDRGRTVVSDLVEYDVPGGSLIERLLVRPELRQIFAFRHHVLTELFGRSAS